MLVSLDGFVDAGAAGKQAVATLLDGLQHTELATFDIDGLLDYRSRRPVMIFNETTWVSYAEPKLSLTLLHDLEGTPSCCCTAWSRTAAGRASPRQCGNWSSACRSG